MPCMQKDQDFGICTSVNAAIASGSMSETCSAVKPAMAFDSNMKNQSLKKQTLLLAQVP